MRRVGMWRRVKARVHTGDAFRVNLVQFFIVSLTSGIDAEMEQRYSEAQIPDLVAYAIPKVLEAVPSPCEGLSRTGRVSGQRGVSKCALRLHTASKQTGLIFASSSADKQGRAARGRCSFKPHNCIGGH